MGPRGRGLLGRGVGGVVEIKEVKEAKGVKENDASANWQPARRIASYGAEPIVLGRTARPRMCDGLRMWRGDKEGDYPGKDVKGKIVLWGHSRGGQELAVGKFRAAGL